VVTHHLVGSAGWVRAGDMLQLKQWGTHAQLWLHARLWHARAMWAADAEVLLFDWRRSTKLSSESGWRRPALCGSSASRAMPAVSFFPPFRPCVCFSCSLVWPRGIPCAFAVQSFVISHECAADYHCNLIADGFLWLWLREAAGIRVCQLHLPRRCRAGHPAREPTGGHFWRWLNVCSAMHEHVS